MFEIVNNYNQNAVIKVIGVGGGGGNAISSMLASQIHGADFIIANTDVQALRDINGATTVQIGSEITKGLGAGADTEKGRQAALEASETLKESIEGADMLFIAAGMGGGTGTGASHVIARAAKELNILTVGVVTLPFLYEGPSRMRRALQGLEELKKHVDTNIVIPNQNLFKVANEKTTFEESFELSNRVLKQGVQSVTDLMVRPGLINLDFADVETVMSAMGKAMMGTGEAEGEGRAAKAAEMAISNPLIDDYTLKGAKGLLVNITGGKDLKLFEVDEAVNKVRSEVDTEAELIIGAITDPSLDGKMRVSIVATALDGQQPESKSVINMVHRIQNRNPGYSEFQNSDSHQSFNFSSSVAAPISEGATALKLENEIQEEAANEVEQYDQTNNEIIGSTTVSDESIVEETQSSDEPEISNGLENFEIEEETPELFNLGNEENSLNETSESQETDNLDEDDLEIPAFLRRQKN